MHITRRQAREWAIQILTAADLNRPEDLPSYIEDFFLQLFSLDEEDGGVKGKINDKMKNFVIERVAGVFACLEEIDSKVDSLLVDGWCMARLGTVERAVLRMGIWEIDNAGIEPAVVINEAVDLVNWFSSPKSRSLINGILDRYSKTK